MILKHRDKELLRFEWIEPQGVRIVSVCSKWLGFPGGTLELQKTAIGKC
jgi:hypothetical protein